MAAFIYNRLPVFLQNIACTLVGLNTRRTRYSRHFYRYLNWLEETDKWSLEHLREYQNKRLRAMVKHCYQTVPFYREQFDSLKIKPDDIQEIEDLKLLPVLTKDIVRANCEKLLSTKFKKSSLVQVRTSGTTGAGLAFYHQPETINFQAAIWWRFRRRIGLELHFNHATFSGKPVVALSQSGPPFWRYNPAMHQVYFSVYHLSQQNLPHYFDCLDKHKFVYYDGYPSIISILAEFMLETGLKLRKPPKIIVTGSETLLPSQARMMEQAFGCPVVDQYATAEAICGLSRCEHGLYHEDMEIGIIERDIIEKHSDGISARIIATGLIDEAMPLLRYDIGDVVTFTSTNCSCGHPAPAARYIDGRIESYILTPDGRRIGRMARVFADLPNVYESQIIQTNNHTLIVRVVKAPNYNYQDQNEFEKTIRAIVGQDMIIRFEYVSRIPREKNGKFRAVISQL